MTNPTLVTTPFAENGDKNVIPESVGAQPQNATMQAGFPPITQQSISEGGIPPERNDFNGILNLYGRHIVHLNKGLPYEFDAAFATAIGGYPLNARIMLTTGDIVKNTLESNTNNPNSDMTGWINELGEKADKYGYRWGAGGAGSESAINTIMGYFGNAIASGIRGAHVQQGSQFNENIIGGDPSTIGLPVPNVVDGTQTFNAQYAVIIGYDNVNNALAGLNAGFHCYIAAPATHGAIWGGSFHEILDGDYSSIIGGTKNVIDFAGLSGNFGAYSAILGGGENELRARMSSILAGTKNRIGTALANKEFSGISNSNLSTIDGNYASVTSGNECKSTKDYSHTSGKGAIANNVGERAFSTGKFTTAGDSGQSILHLMRQTTNATQTQLLCSDDASGNTIVSMGNKTSLCVKATIAAYNTTTNSTAAFEIVAHLSRDTGNAVLNAHTVTPIHNPESLAVAIVPSTTLFQVRVTGLAANTINWVCKLDQVWSRNV